MYKKLSFNQDKSCIVYTDDNAFMIYDVDPFMQRWGRTSDELGCEFIFVEMLYKTNILIIVANDKTNQKRFAKNKLVIWDDHMSQIIGSVEFEKNISSIKTNKSVIVVGTHNSVHIYSWNNMEEINCFEAHDVTFDNLCLTSDDNYSLVFPISNNEIKIYKGESKNLAVVESKVQIMTTNRNLLAVASERGTILKIIDTVRGEIIACYRRGIYGTKINCMCFDSENEYLAVTSEKGTLHIFKLDKINKKSLLGEYMPNIIKPDYLNSEWSSISLHLKVTDAICCFIDKIKEDHLIVVSQSLNNPIKLKIEDNKILKA